MSKKLIAGLGTVAALGIAALPLVGTFAAEGDSTDTTDVRVRVIESVQCQSTGTNAAADFVWLGRVAVGQDANAGFTVTGSTNSARGFSITGVAGDLDLGTLATPEGDDENPANAFSINSTTPNAIEFNGATAGDGKWWLTGATSVSGANITLAPTAAAGTQSYSLTANVRPDATNTPGIYQGSIEWTCAVNQQ